MIAIRHAWLQKHPSPVARAGEFHWYPADGDRDVRTTLVERMRGIESPAVLWELAPGRVVWATTFAAIAADMRRYVGLVLTIASTDGASALTTADLLEAIVPPPAAPWTADLETSLRSSANAPANREVIAPHAGSVHDPRVPPVSADRVSPAHAVVPPLVGVRRQRPRDVIVPPDAGAIRGRSVLPGRADRDQRPRVATAPQPTGAGTADAGFATLDGIRLDGMAREADRRNADLPAIVRALLSGGTAVVGDPLHAALPGLVASLERWLPTASTPTRRGAWIAATPGACRAASVDRVAELAAAGWRDRGSMAARAWRLLGELADARDQSLDVVAAALDGDAGAALTEEERRAVAGKRSLGDVLHAWGRGRLDRSATAGSLATRLADAVALQIIARLAGGGDPRGVLAEARWHALLPAARRTLLFATLGDRVASLRALLDEDMHARNHAHA